MRRYSTLKQILWLTATWATVILSFSPPAGGAPARKIEIPPLEVSDCGKCHQFQSAIFAKDGGRHQAVLTCLDCHPQHPPRGAKTIPRCSQCHTGTPHFQLDDCRECHTNSHMPVASLIFPAKPARKACLSCHESAARAFADSPSRHGKQSCTFCHDQHGKIPDCLDCHASHVAGQDTANCRQCHTGHRPLEIVPTGYIPVAFCRSCHQREFENLGKTRTFHGSMACTFCHKGAHPSSPACRDCHGLPHGSVMHAKRPDCLICHQDPHFLVN